MTMGGLGFVRAKRVSWLAALLATVTGGCGDGSTDHTGAGGSIAAVSGGRSGVSGNPGSGGTDGAEIGGPEFGDAGSDGGPIGQEEMAGAGTDAGELGGGANANGGTGGAGIGGAGTGGPELGGGGSRSAETGGAETGGGGTRGAETGGTGIGGAGSGGDIGRGGMGASGTGGVEIAGSSSGGTGTGGAEIGGGGMGGGGTGNAGTSAAGKSSGGTAGIGTSGGGTAGAGTSIAGTGDGGTGRGGANGAGTSGTGTSGRGGTGGGGTGGGGTSGGGTSGGGTSGGGTSGGGGTGDYQPPTGGYLIKSSFLSNPDLAIAHARSTADFYAKAVDPQFGGFFTYLDRQGKATGSNKSFVVQSRDAYAFVRAFMLSGDEHYLDLARQALTFLYAHGWDSKYGGFIFMGNQQGAAQPDPSGSQSPKWSFVQHYGLVGINAMCDATRSLLDCGWLDKGITSLDQHLWDGRAGYQGYYNNANVDFSSARDKGFTPTIDGITTHVLNDYLITGRADYRQRFFWLADNAADRLAANMTAPGVKFGFPEDYNSNWVINTGSKFGFVGHIYKTAWCLARAYLIDPQEKYRSAARQILLQMYQKGGFDRTNGAPNYSFNWDSGVNSTDKEYWQLEQAILSGIYAYAIATSDADRAIYLEVADRTLDFYVKHLFDAQYGGIFYQTNADGSSLVRTDKGDQWEGAYHDVELSYYVYVDGNLLLWHRPITLYYRFEATAADRDIVLSPIPLRDTRLAIASVSHAGAPYSSFDGATRSVHLPAGTSGVFGVTFKYVGP